MNNNIFNFALKCGEINRDVLCEMCDQMDDAMRARFVEAVLCIVNVPDIVAEIPQTSIDEYRGERTFKSYNYLYDVVTYTYKEKSTRYFKEQDKADKFAESGQCGWNTYEGKPSDEYHIEATHIFDRENTCSLESWNNHK